MESYQATLTKSLSLQANRSLAWQSRPFNNQNLILLDPLSRLFAKSALKVVLPML
jgi:hypothetical protein